MFTFPSERRELYAREVLASPKLTIATCPQDRHMSDPLGSNWMPMGWKRRFPLIELWRPEDHL